MKKAGRLDHLKVRFLIELPFLHRLSISKSALISFNREFSQLFGSAKKTSQLQHGPEPDLRALLRSNGCCVCYRVQRLVLTLNENRKFGIFLINDPFCPFQLAMGAAYGTAKSGTGIAAMSIMRPELIMKSIIPVVMAGIVAIYGLVVAVLIAGNIEDYTKYKLIK